MSSILSINKSGELKRVDNSLVFFQKNKEGEILKKIKIPIKKISQIDIYSNISLNTDLLYFLNINKIGINFFNSFSNSYYGEFNMWNQNGSEKLMIKQFNAYLNHRNYYIKKFYIGIIDNILYTLSKYQKRSDIGKKITLIIKEIRFKKNNINNLIDDNYLLFEASIWKTFYSSIDLIISNKHFKFYKRTKRPPENRMNALISFINTKLYFTVNSILKSTKLDNRIGFIHELRHDSRFSLALDISELFKPIFTFYFIFKHINNKQIFYTDFKNEIFLSDDGLTKLNKLYFDFLEQTIYLPSLKRKVTYKYLIKIECYKLIKKLYDDIEYSPINFKEIFNEDNINI